MTRTTVTGIFLTLLLGGCVSLDPLSERMAGWQGAPVTGALYAWGEPAAREAFGDQTVYVWRDHAAAPQPAAAPLVVCERLLAVDAAGTVTGWRWRGDACPQLHHSAEGGALLAAAD